MVIDEPELHIHPQMQKKYLKIIHEAKENLGLQFILVTHSPIFLNSETIRNVYRFYKDVDDFSNIIKPNIIESDKDLMHILTYTNSSKIFFANKVILVEGPTDEYFYSFFFDEYRKSKTDIYGDIEILMMGSKNAYPRWKEFLTKFKILHYYIADLDNIFNKEFSIVEHDTRMKLREDFESTTQDVDELLERDYNYRLSRPYIKCLLEFVKLKKPAYWNEIIEKIQEKYADRIYILQEGELEDYLGLKSKKLIR